MGTIRRDGVPKDTPTQGGGEYFNHVKDNGVYSMVQLNDLGILGLGNRDIEMVPFSRLFD